MPIPSDTGHTFRVRAPSVYERGRALVVEMEARLGASLVAPSSGAFTLKSPTGATVSTSSVTITGSIATATVPAGDLPATLAYGDGYTEEWDLVIASVTTTARREAYIARRALHCPVTQADLESLHPRLSVLMGQAVADLQGLIDEAWSATLQRLVASGRWPESIIEPASLRGYVQHLALHLVFRAMQTAAQGPAGDRYTALAEQYRLSSETAWGTVRTRVDTDQDGTADTLDRKGATQVVRRSSAGGGRRWPYRAVL
jgi:hypothetical protein